MKEFKKLFIIYYPLICGLPCGTGIAGTNRLKAMFQPLSCMSL